MTSIYHCLYQAYNGCINYKLTLDCSLPAVIIPLMLCFILLEVTIDVIAKDIVSQDNSLDRMANLVLKTFLCRLFHVISEVIDLYALELLKVSIKYNNKIACLCVGGFHSLRP